MRRPHVNLVSCKVYLAVSGVKEYWQESSPDGFGILYRLTAPVGGEGGNDAKRNVDQASEKAEREGKSAYNKIKDSIGGFFGQAKETGCDPQLRTCLWRSFPVGSFAP